MSHQNQGYVILEMQRGVAPGVVHATFWMVCPPGVAPTRPVSACFIPVSHSCSAAELRVKSPILEGFVFRGK